MLILHILFWTIKHGQLFKIRKFLLRWGKYKFIEDSWDPAHKKPHLELKDFDYFYQLFSGICPALRVPLGIYKWAAS